MKRRGVELSMNVIIIAAIALIILVVLVLLITNAVTNVRNGTKCTGQLNGQCASIEGSSCAEIVGEGYVAMASDCPTDETCCVKPFGGE